MQYRTLGRTGLEVSLLGYGTGGGNQLGQRAGLSDAEQDALIGRCLDLGINFFDTAAGYGRSEEILGRALTGAPRDSYYICTKWSHHRDDQLLDPEGLAASVERSLARLRTDYVDVILFHTLFVRHYMEVAERYAPVMQRLQQQGKVRFIGFTETMIHEPRHEVIPLALTSHPGLWDVIMLRYGIFNQWAVKEALPAAMEANVGIINMAPIRRTLTQPSEFRAFLDECRAGGVIPADALLGEDPLGWLVHDDVDSVITAGYRFAADHPGISTVLTGTSRIDHLEKNAAAIERPYLDETDHRRLVELFSETAANR